ncbi:type III pantothenate kinase [Rhodospirillum centenum]|uniref:Type III pantothenate kinase n=1 Tax=Rhodospirillum centenum (strain ATCC 51521 / SW) TaxID=414684 RepID=COAX_RHOCS|nr:type III pantothenate kinase [Rhodospirillum centenum]B6ISW6.1 RecName: Full=Type III pantothenate kinase; AltName: Full=PanK-III; AltName: Full=Pantothenic acid kinase [Rhodospirillum centenum SW]ACI98637.1 transcriptional regulator, Baf family protein [Rhodospirillum centenum SW]
MLLAIDAGNTNVVFAVFEGDVKRGQWRVSTDGRRTADEHAVWLVALMAMKGLTPKDIHAAILSSVVPAQTGPLTTLCEEHFGCTPMRVGDPGVRLGLEVRIDNPKEAGADRLVNAVAAVATYPPPLVVIDIGTGTTFDVVDANGDFAGGVIAPGPVLSLDALHRVAAQLPKVDILRPDRVIGKGTVAAMQSGMFWGYTGMIEGILTRIKAELSPTGDPPVTVIGTGGLVRLFAEGSSLVDAIDADLTLRGLRLIHQRNAAR